MTTTTAAPPKARGKPGARRAASRPKSATRKTRDAALRREIARIVRPMVARMVAQLLEDRIDIERSVAALAEPGGSIPADEFWKRVER